MAFLGNIINELEKRKVELVSELNYIDNLLGLYTETSKRSSDLFSSDNNHLQNSVSNKYINKGDLTWEDYAIKVLKELGGSAKSRDIANYVIKANPSMNEERAENAVRHHMSKLFKAEIIDAESSNNRKLGFTYKIKEPL